MASPKGHWASRLKLDFTAEFDEKGIPFEKTQDELDTEDLQELETFFRIKGGNAQVSLTLLAAALQNAREKDMPKGSEVSAPTVKFAYRWRANARMRAASKSNIQACEEPASEAPAGAAAPAGASGSVSPLLPAQSRGSGAHGAASPQSPRRQSPCSPRAGGASPWLPPGSAAASARRSAAPAREPTSPSGTPRAREPSSPSRSAPKYKHSLSATLYSLWEDMDTEDTCTHQELLQQARGPITPMELQGARPPVPLSASDLPPIFERPRGRACEQSEETHYEYFHRRLPNQDARRRDYKQRQVNSARRTLNYRVDRLNAGEPSASLPRRVKPPSAPHSARETRPRILSTR